MNDTKLNYRSSSDTFEQSKDSGSDNNINPPSRFVKCPQCGCQELQVVSMTDNTVTAKGKGYSGSKGCLGYLLFGPCGLLCGDCGSSQNITVNTTTKLFWVCSRCGHRFRNLEDLQSELHNAESKLPVAWISAVFFWVLDLAILYGIYTQKINDKIMNGYVWITLVMFVVLGIVIIVGTKGQIERLKNEYIKLEEATRVRREVEATENVWKCPSCGRYCSGAVDICYCGYDRRYR